MDYTIYILYIIILFYRNIVVSQFCDPDIERIICKNHYCVLWCRPMTSIQIISASFGRANNNACSNVQYDYGVTCSASTAMQNISTACTKKIMCIFEASNEVFGNHCFSTKKYVKLIYTCKEKPQTTSSTSQTTGTESNIHITEKPQTTSSTYQMTGFIVCLVVLSLIVFLCFFALLYQRLKKKHSERIMNSVIYSNSPTRDYILSTSNNSQPSDSVYHQYSETLPYSPEAGTCTEFSSCIPVLDYSCQSSPPGNSMDYNEVDCVDGVAANKFNLGLKSNVNDGAYFILDQKETSVDKSKELQRESATKSYSNEATCELAQSMDQTNSQGNLSDCIRGKYGASCEYNPVQNINQTKRRRENLYDRVVDNVYDVASHKYVMKDDDTYDH